MPQILTTLIEEELRSSYIDYAMSVIIGRALPDVRDGLKPVQRRILYAMRELGLFPGRPFRKSATVVGEVIGKYHPHGDMPVYEALVRMAQDFSLRYPLIEGQGNFGSIDGDPPAAYRYTEARLAPTAVEMLRDLDEETVDFVPNFDGRLKEPVVLPAAFPNLLVNGSSGIAVGMATNIPPHNLGEVVDALVALIEDPATDPTEYIKGPDFPTGAQIIGIQGIKEAYLTGKGRIVVRAKYHFEEGRRGHPDRIVVTELPYQVNKASLIERIAHLVREKRIEGISDLRDESDREGIRVVIELKKGAQEQVVLNQLLKHTPLQTTFGIILIALIDNEPRLLTLREMLSEYLKHREQVIERRTRYRLKLAEKRAHILEGFRKALDHIDEIVELIKASEDQKGARAALVERFGFSEAQAQAILDLKLGNLTRLDRSKIESEYARLLQDIERYRAILASRPLLLEEVKKELLAVKEKFADPRRTEILPEDGSTEFEIEDLIPREEMVVTLTRGGYIKRTPIRSYRTQGRGGVGRTGLAFYEDDSPLAVVTANTHDHLLFLSNQGRAFWLKAYQLEEGGLRSKGRPLRNYLHLQEGERIVALLPFTEFQPGVYLVLATERGYVKKTAVEEFINARARGVVAIALSEGDTVVGAALTHGQDDLLLVNSHGLAVRFNESEVRPMGRATRGVRGIRLVQGARVVSLVRIEPEETLLTVTEKGYGKRVSPEELTPHHRGGKGILLQRLTPDTGEVVRVLSVRDGDHLLILTQQGTVIRMVAGEIRPMGRAARGVRLIRLREGDRVVDATVIEREGGRA